MRLPEPGYAEARDCSSVGSADFSVLRAIRRAFKSHLKGSKTHRLKEDYGPVWDRGIFNRWDSPFVFDMVSTRLSFATTFTWLGAFFCIAAFAGALPNCWNLLKGSMPAILYLAMAAVLAATIAKRSRRTPTFCALLLLVALTLRVAWVLKAPPPTPDDDYGYYREMSLACLQGDWAGLIETFFPWGYVLYLYGLGRLLGSSPAIPIYANAIVGSLTALLIYAAARRLCGEREARFAGLIYAVWPGVIYWTSVLCSEIPHLFFYIAALVCLLVGVPLETEAGSGKGRFKLWWLAAGGILSALAEFIRPVSPLLLLPFVLWVFSRRPAQEGLQENTGRRAAWRGVAAVAGAYIVCLSALLTAKSIATGYPNFSSSHTLGINLSSGLNWESRGSFSLDDYRIWDAADPREVNRRGMRLAFEHFKSMLGRNWWQMPALALVKFQRIWSIEACSLDANYIALLDGQRHRHWLAVYGMRLAALGQVSHAAILALAAMGFWRTRRTGSLALLGCILLTFALVHTVIEVDDRYHFAVQSLLAIAAANAFNKPSASLR